MKPVLKLTRQFDTEHMEREMNRAVNSLYDFAGQVVQLGDVKPEIGSIVRTETTKASYDVLVRVSPATDDTVVTVQLPPPVTTDGGRICRIARVGLGGAIILVPVSGALLNGEHRLFMYQTLGMAEIRFDGVDFWTSYAGALSWGEGL